MAMTDEPFAPCAHGCDIPADLHRHYRREPGDYFACAPFPCCGRAWARFDEFLIFDQCMWCREDGKPILASRSSR